MRVRSVVALHMWKYLIACPVILLQGTTTYRCFLEVLSVILVLPVQLKTAAVMKPSILTSILRSNSFAGGFSAGDLIT